MKEFYTMIPFPVFVFVEEEQTIEPLTEDALQASFWEILPAYYPDMKSIDELAMEPPIICHEGELITSDIPASQNNSVASVEDQTPAEITYNPSSGLEVSNLLSFN
jgi:hypothetical protein